MNADLVTIRDLCVDLGGNSILRGVNAGLARGRITALIGLNGSGKSTLLRALVKEAPYRGEIAFHCGHDHTKPTPEHVGYVPQKLRIEGSQPLTNGTTAQPSGPAPWYAKLWQSVQQGDATRAK